MEKDYVKEDIIDHEFYSFRQLIQEDVEEAAWLTSREFSEKEPVTKALGITAEEFYTYALPLAQRSAECGLGVVVKERSSDVLVGCTLTLPDKDPVFEKRLRHVTLSEKFGPDFALFSAVRNQEIYYNAAHLITLAVDKHFIGHGTPFSILTATALLSKWYRYEVLLGEASNIFSRKASIKIGGIEINSISYKDFLYKDQAIFKNTIGKINFFSLDLKSI